MALARATWTATAPVCRLLATHTARCSRRAPREAKFGYLRVKLTSQTCVIFVGSRRRDTRGAPELRGAARSSRTALALCALGRAPRWITT